MNAHFYWFNLLILFTAVMWFPYAMNRAKMQGFLPAMGYDENLPGMSPWAERLKKAHANMVENLVLIVPAFFMFTFLGGNLSDLKCALMVIFFARIVYTAAYTFAIPYLRSASFAASWGCTIWMLCKVCIMACPQS